MNIQLRKLTIVLLSKHASTDEEKIQRIHNIYVDRAYTENKTPNTGRWRRMRGTTSRNLESCDSKLRERER